MIPLTLKQLRIVKGKTQSDMAEMLGVHRNTYAAWEDDPESISIANAKKIAAVLGESIDSIFFG